MGSDAAATTFITAPDGFIGTELVNVLMARGHQVSGLAPSECPSPVLLTRNTGGVWFAAGILKSGDDD